MFVGIVDDDPIVGAGDTNGDIGTEAFPSTNATAGAAGGEAGEDDPTNQSIFDDEDKSKVTLLYKIYFQS